MYLKPIEILLLFMVPLVTLTVIAVCVTICKTKASKSVKIGETYDIRYKELLESMDDPFEGPSPDRTGKVLDIKTGKGNVTWVKVKENNTGLIVSMKMNEFLNYYIVK